MGLASAIANSTPIGGGGGGFGGAGLGGRDNNGGAVAWRRRRGAATGDGGRRRGRTRRWRRRRRRCPPSAWAAPSAAAAAAAAASGGAPEFLRGVREDVYVEQRHQTYPQTLALLRLLRAVLTSHRRASLPPPPEMPHYISFLATDLLPAFDDLTHRTPCGKWQLAASVLATFLALLDGYRPSEDAVGEAPPAEDASMMAALLVPRYAADGGHAAGRAGGGGAGGGGAGGAGGALGGGLGGAGGMGGFGGGMSGAASRPRTPAAAAAASAASWPAVPPPAAPTPRPVRVVGGAARGAPVGYTLPSLHPAFLLHCAFAMPRSQLLHSLHRLLAAAAATLHTFGDVGAGGGGGAAADSAAAAAAPNAFWGGAATGGGGGAPKPAPPKGGYGAGAAPASVERALVTIQRRSPCGCSAPARHGRGRRARQAAPAPRRARPPPRLGVLERRAGAPRCAPSTPAPAEPPALARRRERPRDLPGASDHLHAAPVGGGRRRAGGRRLGARRGVGLRRGRGAPLAARRAPPHRARRRRGPPPPPARRALRRAPTPLRDARARRLAGDPPPHRGPAADGARLPPPCCRGRPIRRRRPPQEAAGVGRQPTAARCGVGGARRCAYLMGASAGGLVSTELDLVDYLDGHAGVGGIGGVGGGGGGGGGGDGRRPPPRAAAAGATRARTVAEPLRHAIRTSPPPPPR